MRCFIWAAAYLLAFTSPVKAEVDLVVSYSETADLYSLMDNVSGWFEGFTIPAYRDEWQRRFGWTETDQKWADRYAEYRRRTFINDETEPGPSELPDGIFASGHELMPGSDPLATYLLAQPKIDTALRNLGSVTTPEDAQMLRGFYRHFQPGWKTILRESQPLTEQARRLQSRLNSATVTKFLSRVSWFYRSEVNGQFTVFFTHRPPGKETSAEPLAGSFMLLHSPVLEGGDDEYWDTVVMHELVHYISAKQSPTQKRILTARFLERCPLPSGAKRLWLLEEPLAVAWGQSAYSTEVLNQPLNPNDNWYAVPWVNIVARAISPSVLDAYRSGSRIEEVVDQAADRCNDLNAIVAQLGQHIGASGSQ
jgi:hypothetical protein